MSRPMPLNEEWNIDELLKTLKREIDSREICFHMSEKQKNPVNPSEFKRKEDLDGKDELFIGSTLISSGFN